MTHEQSGLASSQNTGFNPDPVMTYQVGGSLPIHASSYVERPADSVLYQALKNREFCYILNSRQMGKSSLQVRTLYRLREDNIRCLLLDLTTLGNQSVTPEQWYASILHDLMLGFGLEVDFMAWWEGLSHVSVVKRFSLFLETVLLAQIQSPIVIVIDEIDSVLSLSFPCDDFFALLRSCYNRRSTHPEYQRLTFVLVGVATPAEFMVDKQRTPFNIGRPIDLQGFTFAPNSPLLNGLQAYGPDDGAILKEVLAWTNGQPFLTQKVCKVLAECVVGDVDAQRDRSAEGQGRRGSFTQDPKSLVCSIVQRYVLDNWEAQDEPEHLRTIRNRLLYDDAIAARLLGLYQQLLRDEAIGVDTSPAQLELRLAGLVIEKDGLLAIKNPIYQHIFDAQWVEQQLAALRPYTSGLKDWVASQYQDRSALLQGLALKAALAWAEDKRLSDLDYRFLSASQEQAQSSTEETLAVETFKREQAQIALDAAKEASQILGQARHCARQQKYEPNRRKRWVTTIACVVLGCLATTRELGGLQSLEMGIFDSFFRVRPVASTDPRVTVVTVDELDIQTLGQFPLSDQVLANLLTQINRYQPRMIGLDIYRDLPVAPGHDELRSVFENTPNLIGIEKLIGTPIQPPSVLAEAQQYGFADQILDGDGTVRRSLLSIYLEEQLSFSLALQLVLGYLAVDGIQPESLPQNRMALGQATLIPLTKHAGAYANADMGGYQILLNYHGDTPQFETVSLRDMLSANVAEESIRDRVVLIGVTSPTVNDLLLTPYSRRVNGRPTQMPGVIVHANIVSQLLSSALEGRPLMGVWPIYGEYGWIMAWVVLGAIVGSWPRRMALIAIASTALALLLIAICYLAFLYGWWVPLVPSLFGFGGSAITLAIITSRQSERLFLYRTVMEIMAQEHDQPAAAQIALEYLKQGENQRNQEFINAVVSEVGNSGSKLQD